MLNYSKKKLISTKFIYKNIFAGILSEDKGLDAERLTNISLNILEITSKNKSLPGISFFLNQLSNDLIRKDIRLEQKLFGCHFCNPIGLAAGFDKNGVAAGIWHNFGFGFAELGTVTWHPQEGNPKPRLFRLAKEQAALNRMGFNNKGAVEMLNTLRQQGIYKRGSLPISIGLNFGKSKVVDLSQASKDYALSMELLGHLADYAVINVSSPNTPGLRTLQEPNELKNLINELSKIPNCPPLLIKIAPDLKDSELDMIADIACEKNLAGIIATNTSMSRLGLENRKLAETGNYLQEEAGGLSGAPLCLRSLEVIRHLNKKTKNKVHLIGVGGIDSPQAAWERISAGASLVQIYTGWIFKGPSLVPDIIEGISKQLDIHGFRNISEATGSEAPWK